jgi:molybdopterin/thiamine biosynthesis adenylyltransferase
MNKRDRDSNGHVIVVGAGGNIGSHLVPLLARMAEVRRLTLIDRDSYESANRFNQSVSQSWMGKPKALSQAHVAREVNAALRTEAIVDAVERVPLGLLRADLIVACLDSRRSRQYVNEVACRLGVPWIDAGVHADGLLARIDVYIPGEAAPCLECRWDSSDYDSLEQNYPCRDYESAPTGAPAALGALAAALQALEGSKLLKGDTRRLCAGEQVVIDAQHHSHFRTRHRVNPDCRFGEHVAWRIEPLMLQHGARTLQDLVCAVDRTEAVGWQRMRVAGRWLTRSLVCKGCGTSLNTLRMTTAGEPPTARCRRCGGSLSLSGFSACEWIERDSIGTRDNGRTLRHIGIHPHDVLTFARANERLHYELRSPVRSGAAHSRLERDGAA